MKYLAIVAVISLLSCGTGVDCSTLIEFNTHEEAIKLIQKADFPFSETIDTPKSSWIKTGFFYRCDKEKGFIIIRNKEDFDLVFQSVPMDIWQGFKVADSHGTFANEKIIGRYPIQIAKE